MTFEIKEKTPDEIATDLKLYPIMRMKLRSAAISKSELEKKLERIFEEEFRDNIALLYYGYINDCLEDFLGCRESKKPQVRNTKVNFGNHENQRKCMFHLCDTLAKLNLNIISSSSQLVRIYDDITTYIENSRKNHRGVVLYDYDFWILYFGFYDLYQFQKNSIDE
ncbi:MAG: hypothetical protein IIY93_00585 [Clostridia bacterium]|nr:hypothetical protein [Clostridia bacterium]